MEDTTISELMINEQIRDKEVRLIGENGEQLGVMSAREAQKLADEAGLDLVKISPKAKPPVFLLKDCQEALYRQRTRRREMQRLTVKPTDLRVPVADAADGSDFG